MKKQMFNIMMSEMTQQQQQLRRTSIFYAKEMNNNRHTETHEIRIRFERVSRLNCVVFAGTVYAVYLNRFRAYYCTMIHF